MNNEKKYKVEFLGEKRANNLLTYKVIILGLYGVGKTTIINKLMKKPTTDIYSPTISADIKTFHVKVNNKIIQIQIWDTCGNEEFAQNARNLFVNSAIAILVYAINDKEKSFKSLKEWYNILLNNSYDHKIILIGNKADLENERKVTREEAENFKNNYEDIKMFFETSAKNGENIDKLLENIAIIIYEKKENDEKNLENAMNDNRSHKLIKENHTKKKKKNGFVKRNNSKINKKLSLFIHFIINNIIYESGYEFISFNIM